MRTDQALSKNDGIFGANGQRRCLRVSRQGRLAGPKHLEVRRPLLVVIMAYNLTVNQRGALRPDELTAAVLFIERHTALLSRCRPANFAQERARLLAAWCGGRELAPEFTYARATDLSILRHQLQRLELALSGQEWASLYAARIAELVLETRLVDAVGSAEFVNLSRQRFQTPFEQGAASLLAHQWVTALHDVRAEEEYAISDDASDPHSLISRIRVWVGRQRLPFRVEVSADLVSLAATGEDFIVVAQNRRLTKVDVERVAVHEVLGHALPRARARGEPEVLFVVGAAGGSDLQEGYAVYCEQVSGVLHAARRAELGLRHLAAVGVWQGAEFVETMRILRALGAPLEVAMNVCMRVYRGGGLGREGTYLPAFCQVSRALRLAPELTQWLGAGRLSLSAIDALRRGGYQLRSHGRRGGEDQL